MKKGNEIKTNGLSFIILNWNWFQFHDFSAFMIYHVLSSILMYLHHLYGKITYIMNIQNNKNHWNDNARNNIQKLHIHMMNRTKSTKGKCKSKENENCIQHMIENEALCVHRVLPLRSRLLRPNEHAHRLTAVVLLLFKRNGKRLITWTKFELYIDEREVTHFVIHFVRSLFVECLFTLRFLIDFLNQIITTKELQANKMLSNADKTGV